MNTKPHWHPLLEALDKITREARDRWNDEAFQHRLQVNKDRLAQLVRERPLETLGAALLAGFVLGRLFKKEDC